MQHTNSKKRFKNVQLVAIFLLTTIFFVVTFFVNVSVSEAAIGHVLAQGNNTSLGQGNNTPLGSGQQSVNRDGKTDFGGNRFQNPLQFDSFAEFFTALIDVLILFAIPIIILMIIYAGFLYVVARGSEENVKKATRALTYAVVGGLLILGAKLILTIIQGTVKQLTML